MKKFLIVLAVFLFAVKAEAGQIIERKQFYNRFDPASTAFVYDQESSTATGDQVAVNTYTQKSIQINPVTVGENIQIRIEGRSKDEKDSPQWAILDTVDFNAASADSSKNRIIDVTEYVDFLRIGIRQSDIAGGTSAVDIEGIFTNITR